MISCSPFSLTSSSERSLEVGSSSSGRVFGGYPYLTSKEVDDVSVSIVFRSVSTVAESSSVTVEDLPEGPLIRTLILYCDWKCAEENEKDKILSSFPEFF